MDARVTHLDAPKCFADLAEDNRDAFDQILLDGQLSAEAFTTLYVQLIQAHVSRRGVYHLDAERAAQAATALWGYLQYLRAWMDPGIAAGTHRCPTAIKLGLAGTPVARVHHTFLWLPDAPSRRS